MEGPGNEWGWGAWCEIHKESIQKLGGGSTLEIAHCYLCFLLKLDVCMLLKFLFSEIGFELSVAENEVILLIPLSAKNPTYIDT